MKKYQQLAEQLREQIASGIWQPGDRLPSLRDQVALSGMSFMTVSHAYQLLESQGYIIARPQSGYYVAPQAIKMPMDFGVCNANINFNKLFENCPFIEYKNE